MFLLQLGLAPAGPSEHETGTQTIFNFSTVFATGGHVLVTAQTEAS